MHAGIGPAPLPAVQIRLAVGEVLEAEAAQRRFLGVADRGFDFALAIGVADATRQSDDPVVGQHVAVERIERGVVDLLGLAAAPRGAAAGGSYALLFHSAIFVVMVLMPALPPPSRPPVITMSTRRKAKCCIPDAA